MRNFNNYLMVMPICTKNLIIEPVPILKLQENEKKTFMFYADIKQA